jgi:plasmid stabilization system protein ParE
VIVSFHRLAEQELNEAAQYYERESPDLGAACLAEAQRCCDAIAEYPEAGQIAAGVVRRRLLRRFPDALLYTIRPNAIRILAVMNLKRRPGYWVGRS